MTPAARKTVLMSAALAATLTMGACARQISPDVHEGRTLGEAMTTYRGVVHSVRMVEVQESDTLSGNTAGGLVGGLAGGAAASRIGQGWGKAAAVAGGAIVGSFLGALVQQDLETQPAIEYVVLTDSGQYLTVVQGPGVRIEPGQRVYVQESSTGRSRIIPAA